MESFEIEITPREDKGSSASKRIRRDGFIPTVIYARGEPSVNAMVNSQDFILLARKSRISQVFTFKSSAQELNGKSAVVKNIQKDFQKNAVLHVDFQKLHENEVISVPVVLHFVGEAPGVKVDGGILTIARHELVVSCLPKLIPDEIKVDVSSLEMGQSIHASALALPEGVTLHGNPEETIVSVVAIRQMVEEAAPAAAAAEGEAAAAAPAEGAAAPAAGGDKKAEEKPSKK